MKENAQRSSFSRGVCPWRCAVLHSLITNPAPTRDNTPLTAPLNAPQSVSSSEETDGESRLLSGGIIRGVLVRGSELDL